MSTVVSLLLLISSLFLLFLPPTIQTTSPPPKKTNNIFFLKTHKTGSSTFSSILKRLAINFNSKTPLQINEAPFNSKTLPHRYTTLNSTIAPTGAPFDVWANHIRLPYGLESAKLLVPNTEQVITAVRNPPDRFASYVCYFDRQCDLKLADAPWAKRGSASRRMGAMDLNHREIINTTHFIASDIISTVEKKPVEETYLRFIVVERFDESLALFSLDFGLSPFDVAYNVMKKKNRASLNPQVREYLTKHQPNDVALYHAANQQLDRRIKGYPKEVFERRLEEMKVVRDSLQRYCFRSHPSVTKVELERLDKGDVIDWNRERGREISTKNSLNKRFALESLQARIRGAEGLEVPKELQGLDLGVYGGLGLQCFLLEMDELRWLKWTSMWMQETKGMDLTVRNMMEKSILDLTLPHRNKHGFGGPPHRIPKNNNDNGENNNKARAWTAKAFFARKKRSKT